jgi:hypothetical protein
MNQPPDVPSSEKQADPESVMGATPEQSPADSPQAEVPPELTDIIAAADGAGTNLPEEAAIPLASTDDDAVVPLDAPPSPTGSMTSPSVQPIRPASAWTAGAESFVGSQNPTDDLSSMPENVPVAEELPLAADVVAEAAIDPNAAALPSEEMDVPPVASSATPPSVTNEQRDVASAASLAAAPSGSEISSDIHAAAPPSGPAAESSNLFGPFLTPAGTESSNIHAGRPSWSEGEDSALSFLGGIRRPPSGSASPPPLAEDVSSGQIPSPADAPDYGAAPLPMPEASNILADLMQPGHHSSAVHISNPGVGRTLRPGSSTESGFDIDVDLGPVPKELEEAEKAAASDILESPLRRQPASETTIPEMYIEDPQEHILSAAPPPPRDPSSIFDADFDFQAATELLEGGSAPADPATAIKPTDSGIIEWSVDEAPVTSPSSDLFSGEAVIPPGPRSAVIKPSSSAILPRPTPQEVAAESAAAPVPAAVTLPSSIASQQRETEVPRRQPISPAPSRLGAWFGGTLLGLSLPLGVGAALYITGVIGPTATLESRSRDTEQRLTALSTELTQAQQQLQQTQQQLQNTQQQLTQAQETARLKDDEQQRLARELQQTSQQFQQVQTQLKQVEQNLQTTIAARKQLETERQQLEKNLSKAQDDLRSAVARREEVEKQLQQAGDQRKKLEADLLQLREQAQKLDKELQASLTQRQNLEKQVQQVQEQLHALAKELQAARLLTEQYDPASLLAAQRRAIALLNTRPDLQQLRQLEEDKRTLTATIQRLQQQVQQQTEAFAKERRTWEEQAAAEQKRLREQLQAAAQKREQELQTQLRQAQQQQESLRQKLAQTPSDTELLQLWLQLLAEARRPADAAAAQQAAQKVLQRVDKASEEAAQAHVLLALAAILTNQPTEASTHLEQAQQSPAYEPARQAQRSWVAIAEQARLAIHDPLAPLRRPPQEQAKDPQLALSHLHQAIQAYRQGRFPQVIQAAEQALLHDPSDPVAWYYLGAARWMLGQRDRATDDFRQGGNRERNSRLSYRELNNLLSPIQGLVREALETARP